MELDSFNCVSKTVSQHPFKGRRGECVWTGNESCNNKEQKTKKKVRMHL